MNYFLDVIVRSKSLRHLDACMKSMLRSVARLPRRHLAAAFVFVAMFCAVGLPQVSYAQNVLMLTTDEGKNREIPNAVAAFRNVGATVNHLVILGDANSVTPEVLSGAPGPYDIVVVVSVYKPIHASNWAAISDAVANRASNAFLLFIDGCNICSLAANAQMLVSTVNAMAPFNVSLGANVQASLFFPLNTASPSAPSFKDLNPLQGGFITYIDDVPADNALYLEPDAAIPPVDPVLDNVFALFVPRSESYGGAGACLFATIDATLFNQNSDNSALGNSFLHAVAQANGACGTPARVSKAFAASQVNTVRPGANATALTITVDNFTADQIDSANLIDNLPAPLQVAGAASSTCIGGSLTATVGTSSVSLSNFSIPGDSSCEVTVSVVWPSSAVCADTTVTNTITPGVDFTTPIGQIFTPTSADLTCVFVAPDVRPAVALPVNRTGLLILLGLLMLAVGARARRRFD